MFYLAVLAVLACLILGSAIPWPKEGPLSRRWPIVIAVLVFATIVAVAFGRDAPRDFFTFDDSYISLAAARNVAEHFELAVVRGRLLQGVTSPLHVVIVGLAGLAVGVEPAARLVSFAAFLFAIVGAGLYAERIARDRRAFALAAGLCVFGGPMLYDLGNGMETSLFTALLIWTFYLADVDDRSRRGFIVRGVVSGAAMLTRPEGLFLLAATHGAAALRHLYKKDREGLGSFVKSGAIAAAVYAPFLVANLIVTGHPISGTVSAKAVFFNFDAAQFPDPGDLLKPLTLMFFTARIVGYVALAGFVLRRRFAEILFLAAFYLSYLIKFPDALNHYRARYQHPLWTLVAVAAAVAIFWAAGRLRERRAWHAAALGAGALALLPATAHASQVYRWEYNTDVRDTVEYLIPMVTAVKGYSRAGESVAAHDVGALTYFSGRDVVDIVGLTDVSVAKQLAAKAGTRTMTLRRILAERRPRLLVLIRDWEEDWLHLLVRGAPGRFTRIWSSPPNKGTGAIYDLYRCQWTTSDPAP
ncbi:MAG: hypothetical protein M5R36_26715 [Deltaproteobacteria bacterium]|nr:hypothetical protein [Deltaproteobacteria bacterium]